MSHINLLKYIVDEKINDVCVLEDDSTSDFDLPDDIRQADHITYLGGWLVNKKMKDIKLPVNETLKEGINELTNSRVLTTRAYYIPKWEHAKGLLDYIQEKKTWKAIDIMMSEYVNHLYYPALSHQILGYESTIGNNKPKKKYEHYV
jgi:GR25 family glycosyltransferase involved in LPS biosynthesis